MLEPNQSPQSRFIYFVGCANSMLNCRKEIIKEIFPDSDYCDMNFYSREEDSHEISLELEIEGITFACYFDENDKCNSCFLYLDKTDNTDIYIEICNFFFKYDETAKLWIAYSCSIKYKEKGHNKTFAFFPLKE